MLYYGKATRDALSSSTGERAMCEFLKKAPQLIISVFNTGNNTKLVCPEFRFGNRYRADFCVLSGHSGGWEVHLIELEPVGAKIFNKDGADSKVLSKAKSQVQEWHTYTKNHEMEFREELARDILKRNIYNRKWNSLHRHHHAEIIDRSYSFRCHYHIVIGRRDSLKGEDISRRSYYHDFNRCELVTYDRILEAAEKRDETTKELIKWRRSWRNRGSEQVMRGNRR